MSARTTPAIRATILPAPVWAALAATCLTFLGAPARAQDPTLTPDERGVRTSEAEPGKTPSDEQRIARNRARWEKLTPEARAKLVDSLKRLQSMSPEERAVLERRSREISKMGDADRKRLSERAERVREQQARAFESLTPEERARAEALPTREKLALVRRLAAERILAREQLAIERLPPASRERLAGLAPVERLQALRQIQKRRAEEQLGKFLLSLPEPEREALRKMSPEERRRRIRELVEQRRRERAAGPNRPPVDHLAPTTPEAPRRGRSWPLGPPPETIHRPGATQTRPRPATPSAQEDDPAAGAREGRRGRVR